MNSLERALNERRVPWSEIEFRSKDFWVFRDAHPVTKGHLLFVPTTEDFEGLLSCYRAAYKFGYDGVERGNWEAFTVRQDCGEAAGQTIMYPHIHMIPRRSSDVVKNVN
jgi:diadenosine tetraphosphate (Ap4A) HIT family hydrolase